MDKLQKTAAWLWLYKERIIFVVMVLVLGQRVWLVINPPEQIIEREGTLIDPGEVIPPEARAPAPPPPPVIYVPENHPELTQNNPFWYHAGTSTGSTSSAEVPEVALALQRVTSSGSEPRAQIRSGGRRTGSYYKVGDTVEGFTVRNIDVDAQTVTLANEATGERRTLELAP